jgi:hypothetical protein
VLIYVDTFNKKSLPKLEYKTKKAIKDCNKNAGKTVLKLILRRLLENKYATTNKNITPIKPIL